MRKRIYALFFAGMLLASFPVSVLADSAGYVKEKKFTADNEEDNIPEFEQHIEKDGVEYTLSDIEIRTKEKIPVVETRYISKDIETVVKEGEAFEPLEEFQEEGITYQLVDVKQEKMEGVSLVEQAVSGYTDYTYPVTKDTVPKIKKITVKNSVTGENMEVDCELVDVVPNGGGWQPNSIDITFYNVDAGQYVWGNITVPGMEGQEIPLVGYEKGTVAVCSVQTVPAESGHWPGYQNHVRDDAGRICRNARADIEQYVEYYRANYAKTVNIEKPGNKSYHYL